VPRTYDLAFRHFRKAVQLRCKQAEPYLAWYYLKGKGTLKDETKAFALYEKIYNEGNLKAGIPLGLLHVEGKSIPRDYQKAVRYLETGLRAENQVLPGEFPAYSTLGKIFYEGKHGVTRDLVRARTMLERSSGERNGESYFLLGTMYMRGEGYLARNEKIAFDCFRKADSLGSIPACIRLGKMYYSGIGTERDPVLAERFLKMAAGYGDLESMKLLAEMLYAKKGSENDDRTALHYFRILAGKGDPAALCRCGEMILNGRGVKKDPALAATYFKRAAEKGHPDGLYFCGMDSWKNGNKKDAFTCLKTAADHGHREATYFAADLLLSGKDSSVPRDLAQGMRYLRLLADAGDRKAQEKFASLCHTGSGRDLKQDLLLAEKYYKLAAAQNSIVSCRSLARIFYGKGDFKQAFFWADKALSLGRDPESSAIIGTMYYKGEGRGKDLGKALQYLLEDAQGGNKDSIDKVGRIYYQTGNLQEAEKYLLKTSSADNADILFMLGRISYLGVRSSGPDYPRAMDLLLAAQEKGSVDAMLLLGRMYHRGEGVHQDFAQARSYFRRAADRGAAEGMYLMGSMYYTGEVISPDYLEAMNWFKKAAEKDHVVAMQYIAIMYKEGIGVARNNQEAARWRKRIRTGRK
ncbi:MAG: sel1 repeat family protein, partial [Lentisphaeria bacterium]|nr:sel1 repeat family protein [Lentisphaeria bacterium]